MGAFLFVFVGAFLVFCEPAKALNEAPKPAIVYVKKAKSAEIYDTLIYPARVIPKINTNVLAETDGIVSKIFAPLGEQVSRHQKIMTITHTDPIYQYAPAIVKSPVTGIVSLVEVTEGTQVTKGQRLASVTDPTQIRISVEVPAQDLGSLKKGVKGVFRFTGREEEVPVTILGISPFVDPATGTATAEIQSDLNSKGLVPPLVPGVVGQVSFNTNEHMGISVPEHAVNYQGDEAYLRVVDNGKAKKVPVQLGNRRRGFVEITKGLSENAELIERASRYIADGEAITVQPPQKD